MPSISNVAIGSNMAAASANKARHGMNESIARLSTGIRAMYGGDAAGQAMANSIKANGMSFAVAARNAEDGLSVAQTIESALMEIASLAQRLREVAIQADNASIQSTSDITALTLDMSDAGKAIFNGAISATTITLSADGGLLLPNDGNIGSAGSTAAMQISSGGIVTFADDILIKDGGTIGVASSTSAITIASTGIVTLVDDLILKDAATIGVASSTSAISIASTGIVTFIDDVVIKDGGTIGAASAPTAMTVSSGGIVTFLDDILIKDGGTIGNASVADVMTLASTGIVTFKDDILIKDGGTIGVASSTSAITISSAGIVTLVDDLLLKDACTIGTATTAGAISIAADGLVNLATAAATVNSAVIRTAGTDTIWIPAAAMRPTSSNGCAAITDIETTSGRPDMQVLDFDASSDEHAQFQISMPKSWNEGTITASFYWTTTATDTDGVSWGIQGVCVSDNDTIDVAYGTAVVVDDANLGAAEDLCVSAATGAVTLAGSPAADSAFTDSVEYP